MGHLKDITSVSKNLF